MNAKFIYEWKLNNNILHMYSLYLGELLIVTKPADKRKMNWCYNHCGKHPSERLMSLLFFCCLYESVLFVVTRWVNIIDQIHQCVEYFYLIRHWYYSQTCYKWKIETQSTELYYLYSKVEVIMSRLYWEVKLIKVYCIS